nr:hypothetical protein [Tanacetum cinerariifolium]
MKENDPMEKLMKLYMKESAVTYTSISSDSDGPSWGIPLMNAGEFLEMDPYEEVSQQGQEHPLSPTYIPDPMELDKHAPLYVLEPQHPKYHAPSDEDIQVEDDNEDPEKDPEDDLSVEHEPEDDDEDPEEDPNEEHEKDDLLEEDMPPQKRFALTGSPPGCDVAETSVAAAARAPRSQYDFVDTVEAGQGLIRSPGHDTQTIAKAADSVKDASYVRALQASKRRIARDSHEPHGVVVKKLKHLKRDFHKLLYDHGSLHDNVKCLRLELDKVHADLDLDPFNNVLREKEAACVLAFNEALLMDERFLKQKAKIEWLWVGDSNSSYFYKVVKGRINRSQIDAVTNSYGLLFEANHVPMAFVDHYSAFLGQQGVTSKLNTHNIFIKKLDSNVALDMIKTMTTQEVKDAIFSMGNDKSWVLMDTRLLSLKMLGILWQKMLLMLCTNSSLIVNFLRRISDNILLTQNIMHNYHLDRGPPKCAFRVDIQKVYDIVDWSFLKDILMGFGFHHRMIQWTMMCISSTSFSLSINGALHGYFKGERGLRQADPMSLYLFTLIMEVLTLMLCRWFCKSDSFTYHRFCDKFNIINLCFADDLFLFAHGDAIFAHVVMEALDEFKFVSGLTPSLPKRIVGSLLRMFGIVNKSLSTAGRLQLVQSIIGSMHVYWASIFILPSRILLEIEQLMRGFLRSWFKELGYVQQGAYDLSYLEASFSKGIFVAEMDSYFVWHRIGNSAQVSVWFDRWCPTCPISDIVTTRDIHRDGFDMSSMVKDFLRCVGMAELFMYGYVFFLSLWSGIVFVLEAMRLTGVWKHMKIYVGLPRVSDSLNAIIDHIIPMSKKKTARSVIATLVVAASTYFIWQEKNNRLFKNHKSINWLTILPDESSFGTVLGICTDPVVFPIGAIVNVF